jgi:hypothetical protein
MLLLAVKTQAEIVVCIIGDDIAAIMEVGLTADVEGEEGQRRGSFGS